MPRRVDGAIVSKSGWQVNREIRFQKTGKKTESVLVVGAADAAPLVPEFRIVGVSRQCRGEALPRVGFSRNPERGGSAAGRVILLECVF